MDIHNCERELRAYVDSHGLARNVRFPGAVSDVESYLRAADAFVLPSENEAFGPSPVEAMARGLLCYPMGGTIDGRQGDHLLLAPPFIVSDAELEEIVARLEQAIGAALDQGTRAAA